MRSYAPRVKRDLRIAVAQPPCRPLDLNANASTHAETIRAANARLVIFPELSLTGYELEGPAVDPVDIALLPIIEACAETASVALVGASIEQGGQRYIATLMIDGDGADVVYTKSHLGRGELRSHTAGSGPAALAVDGWSIGLAICKDTGVSAHTEGTAALDVDVYVAGVVHAPEELDEQDARGLRIASACDAYVAFASAAGPVGGGYDVTAGESTIWSPTGATLARATAAAGEVVHAVLQPR